jgi:hypothetical protein
MGVNIGAYQFDGMGDLAMVSPDTSWGLGMADDGGPWGLGDFDMQDWDAIPVQESFGCMCGLGADKPATPAAAPHGKKFPWGPVIAGTVGLAAGIGLAFGLRKLLKK